MKLIELAAASAEQINADSAAAGNRVVSTVTVAGVIGFILAIALGFVISLSMSRPLTQGVHMMQELALGHLGLRLKLNRKDEVGVLAAATDALADDLQANVVGTMKKIAAGDRLPRGGEGRRGRDRAGAQGDDGCAAGPGGRGGDAAEGGGGRESVVRGNADKFAGGYHDIVKGVNDTLDAVIGPLNVAAGTWTGSARATSRRRSPTPTTATSTNQEQPEHLHHGGECPDGGAAAGEGGGGRQPGDARVVLI